MVNLPVRLNLNDGFRTWNSRGKRGREIFKEKAIFGIDFGKPFRSLTLEKLRDIEGTGWCIGEWVGWLEPHNSYIHILYRAGIIGLIFIMAIWIIFIRLVFKFIQKKKILLGFY